MDTQFDIPVVLFVFKRLDTLRRIIDRVALVKPSKLYIVGDEGRNDEEKELVQAVRKEIPGLITWNCDVVYDYAEENRGVYNNIGMGALRVFQNEKWAIFLEDDNLPELSYFSFCKEMLERYEDDSRILWVCGTNYLGEYKAPGCASYMFTKHILPCGWASWASKFTRYYDKDLVLFDDENIQYQISSSFFDHRLYKQTIGKVRSEWIKRNKGIRYHSWDYHMMWSIRANGLLGISPSLNQIRNIGIDEFSEHGFAKKNDWASKRLCGMGSYELKFPLQHPKSVLVDIDYEKEIEKILLYPFGNRLYNSIRSTIIRLFGLEEDFRIKQSVKAFFKQKR